MGGVMWFLDRKESFCPAESRDQNPRHLLFQGSAHLRKACFLWLAPFLAPRVFLLEAGPLGSHQEESGGCPCVALAHGAMIRKVKGVDSNVFWLWPNTRVSYSLGRCPNTVEAPSHPCLLIL